MSALRRAWLRLRLWDLDQQVIAAQWRLEQHELDGGLFDARMAEIAGERARLEAEWGTLWKKSDTIDTR